MNTNIVAEMLEINKEDILCVMLTGGKRFCTDGVHKDTDYIVIINNFRHTYHHIHFNKACYFCWNKDWLYEVLKNYKDHRVRFSMFHTPINFININKYILYGDCPKELILTLDEVVDFYKLKLKEFEENKIVFRELGFCKLTKQSLTIALTVMFYSMNGEDKLTDFQQCLVNKAHHSEIDSYLKQRLEYFYNIKIGYPEVIE